LAGNDILVVGAGPSGLFAACELARHGVGVRLVEREIERHRQTRATAIEPGTLEILDSVGLLPPFLEAAVHVRCTRLYRTDLSEINSATFEGIDCRCGFLCSLPQYETERILEAHLESLGGTVERGVTVKKLELDGDGVLAELVHGEDATETVHAGVVIGAGGAHSVTRDSMDRHSKAVPTRATSSSPTSPCRHPCHAMRPVSFSVRMACCCLRRFRAGGGSVFKIWKKRSRPYPPRRLSPASSYG
jgi:2-polyprenyl-6-methoxyphenol hydroxylase-like FAD-dependent oxidoreductase